MNTLSIFCASTGNHEEAVDSWEARASKIIPAMVDYTIEGEAAGYLGKVQRGYEATKADVIAYFHNDLYIHTHGWDELVLREFDTCENCGHSEVAHKAQAFIAENMSVAPSRLLPCGRFFNRVAIVSFFGAKQHGRADIYKTPYDFRQLGRADCISNMVDAESHGRRVLEPCDIAVIDTFSCIVRRSFLDLIGGWPVKDYFPSHCSDYYICLMAHRHKMRVRYVPVSCTHNSGGVRGDGKFDYAAWQQWYGHSDAEMHQANHARIYQEFRDVLPVRIP